jgi:hypothetical protein
LPDPARVVTHKSAVIGTSFVELPRQQTLMRWTFIPIAPGDVPTISSGRLRALRRDDDLAVDGIELPDERMQPIRGLTTTMTSSAGGSGPAVPRPVRPA